MTDPSLGPGQAIASDRGGGPGPGRDRRAWRRSAPSCTHCGKAIDLPARDACSGLGRRAARVGAPESNNLACPLILSTPQPR
jgi:hypothetical protein